MLMRNQYKPQLGAARSYAGVVHKNVDLTHVHDAFADQATVVRKVRQIASDHASAASGGFDFLSRPRFPLARSSRVAVERVQLADHFCHQRRPARLMAGSKAGASVAVEVFVEENKVAPVRVILE